MNDERITIPEISKEPVKKYRLLPRFFRIFCTFFLGLFILILVLVALLWFRLSEGPIEHHKLLYFVENKINAQLINTTVDIGALQVQVINKTPKVILKDVTLTDSSGAQLIYLPITELEFSSSAAIFGAIRLSTVNVLNMKINIIRNTDSTFTFLKQNSENKIEIESIEQALNVFDQALWLSNLTSIILKNTKINFDDRYTGNQYLFQETDVFFTRKKDKFDLRMKLTQDNWEDQKSFIQLIMQHDLGNPISKFRIKFENILPSVLADQIVTLKWLKGFQSKASGEIVFDFSGLKALEDFSGNLSLTEGELKSNSEKNLKKIHSFSTKFLYEKNSDKFTFTDFNLSTPLGDMQAEGEAILIRDEPQGSVISLKSTLQILRLDIAKNETFEQQLTFKKGMVRADIFLSDRRINIINARLIDGENIYHAYGDTIFTNSGWQSDYRVDVNHIGFDRLMEIWPLNAIEKTRKWLKNNVLRGDIYNFNGKYTMKNSVRNFDFNYELKDVSTKFIKSMPPLKEANGIGKLTHERLELKLKSGYIIAANNGIVKLDGSEFMVPNIKLHPALGVVKLKAKGGLQAILHLLDVEKFHFLKKSGLSPNIASGYVNVTGELSFPLSKKSKISAIKMNISADISKFKSDRLIQGSTITSKKVEVNITQLGLKAEGDIVFRGVKTHSIWSMKFGKAGKGMSLVEADVPLNMKSLKAMNVVFPQGYMAGTTQGKLKVILKKGSVPHFSLKSNLLGVKLSIPILNWSKAAKVKGQLLVEGTFGKKKTIDSINLSAAGLLAKGSVKLFPSGRFNRLRLTSLKVGKWLNTSIEIIGKSKTKKQKIVVKGGHADLRGFNYGLKGGVSNYIEIGLDRLILTKSISLYNMKGALHTGRGTSGTFSGLVNMVGEVTGVLTPSKFGSQITIKSTNAGGVLRGAGFISSFRGGELSLVMTPQQDKKYDGNFVIMGGYIKSNMAMAALINAMSIIGLLQQLEGQGIHFIKTKGKFLITPIGVQLRKVSAVGASIGFTTNGYYKFSNKTIDLEGVITPLYMINGIFERLFGELFGREKGEGVFSFTYTMKGPSNNPKVSLNPFSILVPGIFREIFRQDIPKQIK